MRPLADLLDSRFRLPGTSIRFGLDPILGLLPVVGDTVTFLIGGAMVFEAVRLRLGGRVIAAMLGNLAIDWLVGLVPGVDLVLDTAFKAHQRNARLLIEHARSPAPTPPRGARAAPRG